ncbi:tumor necrosis factor receptor type 1-associated DEATH domain protein [Megalops cyprinoides]|uniref:tumor necrosis factor receptor type 1-associated DEATH domain protein n=1 Tax=Megalops cyprinoides TaxID=118141 RepID=UPI001864EE8C|nr:tumor necrosis factor receptor type 1-associated DEATH domain protein [Megalops cyprinoides]XP_036399815.1 tumor necrosis factor receptor type 1-associated DEATH domain protein [Megalops cyprinoides]
MEKNAGKKMTTNSTPVQNGAWAGCVFLFLRSACPHFDLLAAYKDPDRKFNLFKVIRLTLSDAAGGLDGYEILKLHDADPQLGVEVKFVDEAACRRFLESYGTGSVQQFFVQHVGRVLPGPDELVVDTQLKAGDNILDFCLDDQDLCLHHIHHLQPDRLQDDEVSRLEQQLRTLALADRSPSNSGPPSAIKQEVPVVPDNCFLFQKRMFDDRQLTSADHQRFATNVGRDWKKVGRTLQKTCRALKGPAIDNLAYEYEREGLYEQAYQLLSRFIQAEGKGARLGRLIAALEENKLIGLAEIMLGIQPKE